MKKIIALVLSLLINSCAVTEKPADRIVVVKKQKDVKNKPENKKSTDSKNKEDDSLYEFIKTNIDKAISYISSEKK